MQGNEKVYQLHFEQFLCAAQAEGWTMVQFCEIAVFFDRMKRSRADYDRATTSEGVALARWGMQTVRETFGAWLARSGLSAADKVNLMWLLEHTF